jgi:hypothetical protein
LTYRNFFLLPDCSISSKHSPNRSDNLKFFFGSVGFNQSIYFLRPLICLLSVQSRTPEIKRIILQSNRSQNDKSGSFKKTYQSSFLIQKNFKDLFALKTLQNKISLSTQASPLNLVPTLPHNKPSILNCNLLDNTSSHN